MHSGLHLDVQGMVQLGELGRRSGDNARRDEVRGGLVRAQLRVVALQRAEINDVVDVEHIRV
eukprot:3953482-Lingulodinium_polyedra.AAC.1